MWKASPGGKYGPPALDQSIEGWQPTRAVEAIASDPEPGTTTIAQARVR
jgi:hypothetical protein